MHAVLRNRSGLAHASDSVATQRLKPQKRLSCHNIMSDGKMELPEHDVIQGRSNMFQHEFGLCISWGNACLADHAQTVWRVIS